MADLATARPARATYGFDAPGVMAGLWAAAILGLGLGGALLGLATGWLRLAGALVVAASFVPLALGLSMLAYGLAGKRRMRDRMIGLVDWRGDEQVLDIGTGAGLLLVGAAKRLGPRGRATGIDIWRGEDLSGNSLERLAANVAIEGVEDRVSLRTEDARRLSFPDASFDVVLSLFCIHNIEPAVEQQAACREIARVLKAGGRVLVGEWLPTHAYARTFREAGLTVASSRTYVATALGPMWMVDAAKPMADQPSP